VEQHLEFNVQDVFLCAKNGSEEINPTELDQSIHLRDNQISVMTLERRKLK
jgi:hypothetical protein